MHHFTLQLAAILFFPNYLFLDKYVIPGISRNRPFALKSYFSVFLRDIDLQCPLISVKVWNI